MLKRTLVRFREVLERVALVAFGFLLALALLEGGLRLAAAFVGPRPASEIARTDRLTVLCLGDSNTYGIAYGPEQAYPGQLQTILERRDPGRFRVLNLALPGTNSSQIVGQLPAWIDRYQPSAVVLLVGINNLWNRTGAEKHWWSRTRSYRLYELLRARLEQELPGPNPTGRVEWARELRDEGRKGEEYRDAHTGRVLARHDGNVWGEHRDPASAWAILDRDLG